MTSQDLLDARIRQERVRWERLNRLCDELTAERDHETRADERLRLERRIEQLASDRDAVERRFGELEADAPRPVTLFYSYSHRDEELRDELHKHLTLLQRQGVIEAWYDRDIDAGANWAEEIDDNLLAADIVLLLVSSDFIASDYCWGRELELALGRQRAGKATVIPVLLRTVDWQDASFAHLQALPRDARPVTSWDDHDAAFADVARAVRRVAEAIRKRRRTTTDPQ